MTQKNPRVCLTTIIRDDKNYINDDDTQNVWSVIPALRGPWWIAAGVVRTEASPLQQFTERLKGLAQRESLFLCAYVET